MEAEQIVIRTVLEKAVIIPGEFDLEDLLKDVNKVYQSISSSVRAEFFKNKYYSGTATLRIVPAIELEKDGKPFFVPGESDPIATLVALHLVMLEDPRILTDTGFFAIVIPFASIKELHGQLIYLMLTHHKLIEKEAADDKPAVYKDCGWRLGITFDWPTSERLAETGIAYIDIPY